MNNINWNSNSSLLEENGLMPPVAYEEIIHQNVLMYLPDLGLSEEENRIMFTQKCIWLFLNSVYKMQRQYAEEHILDMYAFQPLKGLNEKPDFLEQVLNATMMRIEELKLNNFDNERSTYACKENIRDIIKDIKIELSIEG